MKELGGKYAILTGASRGLGPYIARALAGAGIHLALTAREPSAEKLEIVADGIRRLGVRAVAVYGDITSAEHRENIVSRARAELGSVDILVNNAGYERYSPFSLLGSETVQRTIETNLIAAMEMARLVLPDMLTSHSGHIVNIGSVAGKSPVAYNSIYSASKAGLIFWSTALRDELDGTGVGVSVICPGYVSGKGMHARYGIRPPPLAGEVSPERVAQVVVKAIRENRQEIIVWPSPLIRPFLALKELAPGLVHAIYRRVGMYEYFRRKAEIEKKMEETGTWPS